MVPDTSSSGWCHRRWWREKPFPQHPRQFQGQLWHEQLGRVAVAEPDGHQDIGGALRVLGGKGGHTVISILSVGTRARVPEGPGRLVRPQSETSWVSPTQGLWGTPQPGGRPGLRLSAARRGAARGAVFLVPREGPAAGCHAGAFTVSQQTAQRGRVGWGRGTVSSDQRPHPVPTPTSWGGRTSPLHWRVSWQCLRSRVSQGHRLEVDGGSFRAHLCLGPGSAASPPLCSLPATLPPAP